MINEIELAYAEVDAILELLEEDYVKNIPKKIRVFFKDKKNKEYIPDIKSDIELYKQELKSETISILTLLQINYLCDSEEEKQKIINELQENDNLKEEEKREKYNPDNIFKSKYESNFSENKNEIALINYKQDGFIRKVLKSIQSFFRRN